MNKLIFTPLSRKTNKSHIYILLVLLISGMVMVQGCRKENLLSQNNTRLIGVPDCEASVEDGILHFSAMEDFYQYLRFTNDLTLDELSKLEKKNKYKSYYSKVEEILTEYQTIMQDSTSFTVEKMLHYRNQAQNYITITDTNFATSIEGLCNKVINPEGFIMIDSMMYKHEGLMVYETHIRNKSLLEEANYNSTNIKSTKVIKSSAIKPEEKISSVIQWQSIRRSIISHHCRRKRRTKYHVWHYRQPQYSVDGFQLEYDNSQRGWTGIWYGFPMAVTHEGHTHGKGQPWVLFNDYFAPAIHNFKNYDVIWYPPGTPMDPTPWLYIQGTVGIDQCIWVYDTY